jgi:hypothetical protein
MVRKGCGRKRQLYNLLYYAGIHLEGPRKATTPVVSGLRADVLNPGSLEYIAGMMLLDRDDPLFRISDITVLNEQERRLNCFSSRLMSAVNQVH